MKLKSWVFNLIFAAFSVLAFNSIFFKMIYTLSNNLVFTILCGFCLILMANIIFSVLLIKGTTKFFAILFTLINAGVYHFMNQYNIAFDGAMLRNVLETDINEATDLINSNLFIYYSLLGIIPSLVIGYTKIEYKPFFKELLTRILIIILSATIFAGILFSGYKTTAQFLRNNRPVRYYQIPNNWAGAIIAVYKEAQQKQKELTTIGVDAKLENYNKKPNLFVFMVGETARAKNFSLNGYERKTNKPLEKYKKDIIYYKDFDACATSTATALPCIFSKYGRKDFKDGSAEWTENVLDIMKRAGYKVLWKENNSSCKNNCDRIETQAYNKPISRFDEALLGDFDKIADGKNTFIVLHTQGSHGPKYYLRTPKEEQVWQPTCQTENLDKCSQEEIVNIYDNSILYTSKVIAKTIEELKGLQKKYNVAFVYVSDHGESLGENNIYLHAAPYMIAPVEQIKVPFLLWLNDNNAKAFNIKKDCLQKNTSKLYSHDNVFHTLLGLTNIKTSEYAPQLDLLSDCH